MKGFCLKSKTEEILTREQVLCNSKIQTLFANKDLTTKKLS